MGGTIGSGGMALPILWSVLARLQTFHSESGISNEVRDGPIQVATTGNPLPDRRKPMVPPSDFFIRRQTLFNQQQLPSPFENPPHFRGRLRNVRNCAQRPSGDYAVDASGV